MINRDKYVEKLKTQLDQWNRELARWGAQAKAAQGAAFKSMQDAFERARSKFGKK